MKKRKIIKGGKKKEKEKRRACTPSTCNVGAMEDTRIHNHIYSNNNSIKGTYLLLNIVQS